MTAIAWTALCLASAALLGVIWVVRLLGRLRHDLRQAATDARAARDTADGAHAHTVATETRISGLVDAVAALDRSLSTVRRALGQRTRRSPR